MMGHKLISNVLKNTCRLRLFHEFLAALLIFWLVRIFLFSWHVFFPSENIISRNVLVTCQVQKPLKLDILRFDFILLLNICICLFRSLFCQGKKNTEAPFACNCKIYGPPILTYATKYLTRSRTLFTLMHLNFD